MNMNRKVFIRSSIAATMFGAFPAKTLAHPTCRQPTLLLGQWDVHTTFHSGPRKGQEEHATFHFHGSDDQSGTMTITIDGDSTPGHGRWWVAGNGICYCFVKPVSVNNQFLLVAVNHFLPFADLNAKSFTSSGEGNAYPFPEKTAELAIVLTSLTTTRARRL